MGQWSNQGFVAGSVEDYKLQLQNVFTNAFGNDFIVDDDTLPQCILIQELAEMFANADADSIQVLAQLNINTMSGIWLDLVAMARGLTRTPGSPQIATVSVVSNPSRLPFTIPANQEFVCNETGETFIAATSITVSAINSSIQLSYSSEGSSNVAVGNHFHTEGVPGIITMEVIGLSAARERETDADFRTRLRLTRPVFNPTIEHITSEIQALPDIRGVGCAYNDTDQTVGDLPAYSTEFLVAPTPNIDRSTDQYTYWKDSVGKAILWNKVPGSPTYGTISVTLDDPFGTSKTVSFSVPDEVKLGIRLSVAVNEEVGVPDLDKVNIIKENIANYINTLQVGADVVYSKIMSIFMATSSMDVISVKFINLDTSAEYTNQNYIIGLREYASCAVEDIEVG